MIKIINEGSGPYAEITFNEDGSIESYGELLDFFIRCKEIKGWIVSGKARQAIFKLKDNHDNYLYSWEKNTLFGKPVKEHLHILYFYSIEYFSGNVIRNAVGTLEYSRPIQNADELLKGLKQAVELTEEQNNEKIGNSFKVLAFNRL